MANQRATRTKEKKLKSQPALASQCNKRNLAPASQRKPASASKRGQQ